MNREQLSKAVGNIDDGYIAEAFRYSPEDALGSPERMGNMKPKRLITFVLAAALLLSLGVVGYAVSSIHAGRQQELRADLQIAESKTESYVEYPLSDEEEGIVLLSAINDGSWQKIYVDVTPVTEEELEGFPGTVSFGWKFEGFDRGGMAFPELPPDLSLSGFDEIHQAVMANAYDAETQTLTLECTVDLPFLEEALGDGDSVTIRLAMFDRDEERKSFGTFVFHPTPEEKRVFDLGHVRYYDAERDQEIELVALELTPISAVWKLHYEGDEQLHREQNYAELDKWMAIEDEVCSEAQLILADGERFSTGGILTAPFEDGVIKCYCGWKRAIDIQAVERIVLGDLVLWQAE